jgi:hypothetical protein
MKPRITITVERRPFSGFLVCSAIVGQRRVEHVYSGYPKREAVRMFRQKIKKEAS